MGLANQSMDEYAMKAHPVIATPRKQSRRRFLLGAKSRLEMCEAARTPKTAQSAATTNGGTCSWVSTCTGPSQPSRGGSKDSMQTQLQAKDTMIHVGATNHCSRLTTDGTGSPDRSHTSTARTATPSNAAMPPPGIARSRSIAGQVSSQTQTSVRWLSPPAHTAQKNLKK